MSGPFKVSDKVVCIDASPGRLTFRVELVHGRVYVVDGCEPGTPPSYWRVYLTGIDLGYNKLGDKIGFIHTRFRLLEEIQEENRLRREQEVEV